MLGCGGIVDLSEYLSLTHEVSVWVFDNNRPYNLRNIFTNTQVHNYLSCHYSTFSKSRLQSSMMDLFKKIENILKTHILRLI